MYESIYMTVIKIDVKVLRARSLAAVFVIIPVQQISV